MESRVYQMLSKLFFPLGNLNLKMKKNSIEEIDIIKRINKTAKIEKEINY